MRYLKWRHAATAHTLTHVMFVCARNYCYRVVDMGYNFPGLHPIAQTCVYLYTRIYVPAAKEYTGTRTRTRCTRENTLHVLRTRKNQKSHIASFKKNVGNIHIHACAHRPITSVVHSDVRLSFIHRTLSLFFSGPITYMFKYQSILLCYRIQLPSFKNITLKVYYLNFYE